MPVENIKPSQQAKEQLIKIKRYTGLRHWNTVSRWAFCVSLAEPTPPPDTKPPADSSVEMSWKVFAGPDTETYWALLRERVETDGIDPTEPNLAQQFRLHLHRGIGYLAGDRELKTIDALIQRAVAGADAAG